MMRLLDILFPPRSGDAALRDISSDDFLARLQPKVIPLTRPEAVTLLSYADAPVRAAIHEAKYHGNEKAFSLLALALAEYLRDADTFSRGTRVVPVPLSASRRKERGFNQVEEIVRRALGTLGEEGSSRFVLDTGVLLRTRDTVSQVSLPKEHRAENMRGAFRATRPLDSAPTYLLIDDVLTTGATLQAAATALAEAGAEHVAPLALAH